MQLAEFDALENVPVPHAAHVRLEVAVPADVTYCPALQVVHAVQDEAFEVVEYPVAHAVHWRSAVVVPALLT